MLGQERGMSQPHAAYQSLQTIQVIWGHVVQALPSLDYGPEDWRVGTCFLVSKKKKVMRAASPVIRL
jgi:hypothetical protein